MENVENEIWLGFYNNFLGVVLEVYDTARQITRLKKSEEGYKYARYFKFSKIPESRAEEFYELLQEKKPSECKNLIPGYKALSEVFEKRNLQEYMVEPGVGFRDVRSFVDGCLKSFKGGIDAKLGSNSQGYIEQFSKLATLYFLAPKYVSNKVEEIGVVEFMDKIGEIEEFDDYNKLAEEILDRAFPDPMLRDNVYEKKDNSLVFPLLGGLTIKLVEGEDGTGAFEFRYGEIKGRLPSDHRLRREFTGELKKLGLLGYFEKAAEGEEPAKIEEKPGKSKKPGKVKKQKKSLYEQLENGIDEEIPELKLDKIDEKSILMGTIEGITTAYKDYIDRINSYEEKNELSEEEIKDLRKKLSEKYKKFRELAKENLDSHQNYPLKPIEKKLDYDFEETSIKDRYDELEELDELLFPTQTKPEIKTEADEIFYGTKENKKSELKKPKVPPSTKPPPGLPVGKQNKPPVFPPRPVKLEEKKEKPEVAKIEIDPFSQPPSKDRGEFYEFIRKGQEKVVKDENSPGTDHEEKMMELHDKVEGATYEVEWKELEAKVESATYETVNDIINEVEQFDIKLKNEGLSGEYEAGIDNAFEKLFGIVEQNEGDSRDRFVLEKESQVDLGKKEVKKTTPESNSPEKKGSKEHDRRLF